MRTEAGLILPFVVGALGGCATLTPHQVAEPSEITLDSAVRQVGASVDYLISRPKENRAGLILDEVEIVFNVSAGATGKNAGELTVSDVPLAGGGLGGSLSAELTNGGKRGNQITMKFKHLATADVSKGMYSLIGKPLGSPVVTSNPTAVVPGAPTPRRPPSTTKEAATITDINELIKQIGLLSAEIDKSENKTFLFQDAINLGARKGELQARARALNATLPAEKRLTIPD